MLTLGIETSGPAGSVALLRNGRLLGERDLSRAGRRHARTLIAELHELLAEADVRPGDVNAVAVSIGPGSFTGLRVGVTCAKTWAYATGAAVVGVETFLAIATGTTATSKELHVIGDAQRGDLFVGRFRRSVGGEWVAVGDVEIVNTDDWLAEMKADVAVSGPAAAKLRDKLSRCCDVEADDGIHPRAADVARIGMHRTQQGRTDDLWTLEPLYLRKSAAEEQAGRQ